MFRNVNNAEQSVVFAQMHNAPFVFFLTGSRFFETYTSKSDYDFFVKDSDQLRNWLMQNGFNRQKCHSYGSQDILAIYKFNNIHVQVVEDPELKDKIQHVLKKWQIFEGGLLRTNKVLQRQLWNLCYDLVLYNGLHKKEHRPLF